MGYVVQVGCIILVAVIGAYYGMRHFIGQQWWKKKDEAYADVIAALRDAMQYSQAMRDAYESLGHERDDNGVTLANYRSAVHRIKRLTATGPFVVSGETIEVLNSLPFAAEGDWDEAPGEVVYDLDFKTFQNALKRVRIIAESDLGKADAYALT